MTKRKSWLQRAVNASPIGVESVGEALLLLVCIVTFLGVPWWMFTMLVWQGMHAPLWLAIVVGLLMTIGLWSMAAAIAG